MKPDHLAQPIEKWLLPSSWTGALLLLLVTLLMVRLMEHLLVRSLRSAQQDASPDEHPARLFLYQLARGGIWIFAAVVYAHAVPALRGIGTALLTSASVLSIVLGIAAQSTLGSIVSGVALLLYRPFRIGDRIQVSAPTGVELGTVERISLGYTTLRTFDNRRIVLPNSAVSNQTTVNLTSVEPSVLAIVPVSIGYDADLDTARAILMELAAAHPKVESVVSCPVVALGASSVDLSLRAWTANPDDAMAVKFDLLEQAKRRFGASNIEIPYAYQNVVLQKAKSY